MEFSQEELLDAVDRLIAGLFERAGVDRPPVDALAVAETHLGIPIEYIDPDDEESGPKRRRDRHQAGIVLSYAMTDEEQQQVAARGIARSLLPELQKKLGMPPDVDHKAFASHVTGLLTSRLLVPTRLLRAAMRESRYDLIALKSAFPTASYETLAIRLIDLDEPCVIAIVDDGVVAIRRGNGPPANRKLTLAEQECLDWVMERDLPHQVRRKGWVANGWPIAGRRFRRVILRAVPDEV